MTNTTTIDGFCGYLVREGFAFERDGKSLSFGESVDLDSLTPLPEGVTSVPEGVTSLPEGVTSLPEGVILTETNQ